MRILIEGQKMTEQDVMFRVDVDGDFEELVDLVLCAMENNPPLAELFVESITEYLCQKQKGDTES